MKRKSFKMKQSWDDRMFDIICNVFLILFVVVVFYPLYYIVIASFSDPLYATTGTPLLYPKGITFEGYKMVLEEKRIWSGYANTIFYTLCGTLLGVSMTVMAGYALSRKDLPGRGILMKIYIFTMYFGGGMIPNYVLMTYLGLRDTVAAFILPGLIGTYYVLLMKSFFTGIPRELEEAGAIDGLTHIGIFFKIVLPLSKPIIATMALFYMTGYWSNWFNAFLYLDTKDKWPVAYYLRQIINGSATSNDPGATADAAQIASNIKSCCMVLTAAPLICIYPFIQKYFVQGMMLGGVKE